MERPSNNKHQYIKVEGDAETTRSAAAPLPPPPSDVAFQWGNLKRPRCMKFPAKDRDSNTHNQDPMTLQSTARLDRAKDSAPQQNYHDNVVSNGNSHINLRQRSASPSPRILRNSESNGLSNGVEKSNTDNLNNNNNGSTSSDSDAIPVVWPQKFVIGLTTEEKEEDFMAIKGSKLPQRPKKRAKFIQRTLNLVSPGSWLCDTTLQRYQVPEKKVTKKRPPGLRAMGNMDSDSD